jgi:hypothetical protein
MGFFGSDSYKKKSSTFIICKKGGKGKPKTKKPAGVCIPLSPFLHHMRNPREKHKEAPEQIKK